MYKQDITWYKLNKIWLLMQGLKKPSLDEYGKLKSSHGRLSLFLDELNATV